MAKHNGFTGAASLPSLACAIYTRKSSEEGLEQDFNSLHAQREACEAFVLSQKSLGWSLQPTAYDDGGFSGGNVERPALQRLIQDIEAGKVNVIVVYKVDRLTRSLADFAKLVELFDAKGVSFVSVTQQFNTTTSMGRLTLNVLLSFAQFEREVTGERIRDKIAASKRKGLWMGGIPPVGYRAKGRTLELDEQQAPRVREIFALYLELGSVSALWDELNKRGWLTPERQHKRPGFAGNKPFSRGNLYRILSNPVYLGLMSHKGDLHSGQHPPLIEKSLWDAVQAKLEAQRQGTKSQTQATNPSLLSGMLFDETGRRLIPSHSRKGNKRYRYYVTPADVPGDPVRLPANEIEQLVIKAVMDWALDAKQVVNAVGWSDAKAAEEAISVGQKLAQVLAKTDKESTHRAHLERCIEAVEVGPSSVRITIDLVGCAMVKDGTGPVSALIEVAAERKRCGMAVRLVIGGSGANHVREPDQTMIQLINKAREWLERLTRLGQGIGDIAKEENVSPGYVTRLLHLALLAPDITQSIAAGEHPADVTATRLMQALPLPLEWAEQRKVLGMG